MTSSCPRPNITTIQPDITTDDGLFHIDLLLPEVKVRGKQVVIELLDKEHVCLNTDKPLGRWNVRHRILAKYGFHALPMSLVEWEDDGFARDEQLDALLKDCKVSPVDEFAW